MILVLDFGSPYTQLIARRIREEKVYCEIYPGNKSLGTIESLKDLKGIILSGSSKGSLRPDPKVRTLGVPVIEGSCFYPEVKNSKKNLQNFIFGECGLKRNWTMKAYIAGEIKRIKDQVGGGKVLCALSGGVDSSVAAVMVHKAIGNRLTCVYVDHGCQKLGENARVKKIFGKKFGKNLIMVDARKTFLGRLKGVTDPEQKRKIIGHTFIEVFDKEARKLKGIDFLLQGTIYPDIVESVPVKGKVAVKSHHNVGGLPEKMKMKLVEPLKFLFKDEVRVLGKELGMSDEILKRQPFPGPGLAVRCIGEITEEKLQVLKEADFIFMQEIRKAGLYEKIWQSFAIILPVKTVGVKNDKRTYEHVIALRAVNSEDAMTADWVKLPYELLGKVSSRIINEVKGANRVVYDISNKPPATIEWE
ncbi:MAG: glutamine-hydrolyzing GMP synthase [Endomicrobia bacterium]|nr:glutamine-hydrolyzing GMP synthase [Endomicrobiia bacterium]MCL2507317.1 glutamine-hydrolyzing GMP synthase [Endomicrobiia bacterium]